jgi:3-deoxy-D-manno-octulosonic-acid transferase
MPNHLVQKRVYNGVVLPTVYTVLSAASLFHGKLKETFAARRNIQNRWTSCGVRLDERPVWFHVSSVGEYEQAKPVISCLANDYPRIPVALTFTSPSGYNYASGKESVGNDSNIKFMEYLPLDFARNVRFCLAFLDPRLLVFVKFDIWPNLVWESALRGVPSMLIDATLSANSYRFSRLGRRFYRAVYSDLARILAISDHDAERFNVCVPDHAGISVTGDTRFDRVMERKRLNNGPSLNIDRREGRVIIAGSTWPKDEAHLLPALARLAAEERALLIIIAPHEPTGPRVSELLNWAKTHNLEAERLSERDRLSSPSDGSQVLVVDSVGVLAEAYKCADVAYIGGSFSTGVHSVIEPAIMGIPVLFGPVHANSFEAVELLGRGAAVEVTTAEAIYESLGSILRDGDLRREMGGRALSYVESQLGATDRCMETLVEYL